MRIFLITIFSFTSLCIKAQKIENIYFHLYTDSLKKGVYNYINVDGKLSSGRYIPLNNTTITFSSSAGNWDGNSLIIDPSYTKDSVEVNAYFKQNPKLSKYIIIYIKKKPDDDALKTEKEIMEEIKKNKNH